MNHKIHMNKQYERRKCFVKLLKIWRTSMIVSLTIIISNSQKLPVVPKFQAGNSWLNLTTRCALLGALKIHKMWSTFAEPAPLYILVIVLCLTSWSCSPSGPLCAFEQVTPPLPLDTPQNIPSLLQIKILNKKGVKIPNDGFSLYVLFNWIKHCANRLFLIVESVRVHW